MNSIPYRAGHTGCSEDACSAGCLGQQVPCGRASDWLAVELGSSKPALSGAFSSHATVELGSVWPSPLPVIPILDIE